jgi:hypothetical protein
MCDAADMIQPLTDALTGLRHEHPLTALYVVGSRAPEIAACVAGLRGSVEHPGSDVDIGVVPETEAFLAADVVRGEMLVGTGGRLHVVPARSMSDIVGLAASHAPALAAPLDVGLAAAAAFLVERTALPCADSVIYATAQERGAEVWTHDTHFRGLPGVRFVEEPAGA